MSLYLNHLCRNFLCQLLGSLLDDVSPETGILKLGYGDVVLVFLVEFDSLLAIEVVVIIPVNNLLPIPFVSILLQKLFCKWYVTIA